MRLSDPNEELLQYQLCLIATEKREKERNLVQEEVKIEEEVVEMDKR